MGTKLCWILISQEQNFISLIGYHSTLPFSIVRLGTKLTNGEILFFCLYKYELFKLINDQGQLINDHAVVKVFWNMELEIYEGEWKDDELRKVFFWNMWNCNWEW